MERSIPRLLVCLLLTLTLLTVGSAGRAEEEVYPGSDVTAESMIVDVFLLRPVGLAATIFGTATYVLALPFSLPTGSAGEAGRRLVVAPARYTFARPLGQLRGAWEVRGGY